MAYFPVFCDLTGREVLLVGGCRHILEKLQRLQPFQAKLRVICENPIPEVEAFAGMNLDRRPVREVD